MAEALFRDGLCLPSGTAMTQADIERAAAVVRRVCMGRRLTLIAYADLFGVRLKDHKEKNLRASASPKPDGLQHMAQVGAPDLGRFVWPGGVVGV